MDESRFSLRLFPDLSGKQWHLLKFVYHHIIIGKLSILASIKWPTSFLFPRKHTYIIAMSPERKISPRKIGKLVTCPFKWRMRHCKLAIVSAVNNSPKIEYKLESSNCSALGVKVSLYPTKQCTALSIVLK